MKRLWKERETWLAKYVPVQQRLKQWQIYRGRRIYVSLLLLIVAVCGGCYSFPDVSGKWRGQNVPISFFGPDGTKVIVCRSAGSAADESEYFANLGAMFIASGKGGRVT